MTTTRATLDSNAPNSVLQPGELVADKYRVDGVLGSGGMGIVLAARHVGLGQAVAIKVLTLPAEHERDGATERFLREGRATASLDSEHVVRVHDVGTLPNGAPYLVMELLRGLDSSELLMRSGTLPVEEAVDYVMQACSGVGAAHARGIVHRDLKPSNLFLCQRDEGLWVKVLDFGISRVLGSDTSEGRLTGTRSTLGSPFYMSPEQVRDPKAVDFRGDVWALGVILHELLTGAPAFDGASLSGVCAAIVTDPPAALRLKRPEVPPALEAVVLKCLEKDPGRRFQTALELRAALEPFLPAKSEKRRELPVMFPELLDMPMISAAPTLHVLTDSGNTLPSAVLRQSGERQLRERTPAGGLLIEPAQVARAEPASTGSAAAVSAWRGTPLVALLVGLTLALVSVLWLRHQGGASASLKPAADAPGGRAFTLSIESSPSGADVLEGAALLGTTPIRISVDAAGVAHGPRTFTLRAPGRAPYTLVQGPSDESVRVVAELSPLPAPQASAPAPQASAPVPPARPVRPAPSLQVTPRPVAAKRPAPSVASAAPASSPDIRLQR